MDFKQHTAPTAETGDAEQTYKAKKKFDEEIEKFNFKDFLRKTHRNRISVRLYSRGDLNYRVTVLRNKAFEAMQKGQTLLMKRYAEDIKKAQEEYLRSYLDITLTEASREEQARRVSELEKKGVTGRKEQVMWLIASQIEHPEEITGADLLEFSRLAPAQTDILVNAWKQLQHTDDGELPGF